jgi:hypothetical protein
MHIVAIELYLSDWKMNVVDEALFSFQNILQIFSDSPSYQIFRHMSEALNIDKK